MASRSEWAAVVFWLVISAFFAVILIQHVIDREKSYPLFEFEPRQKSEESVHGPIATVGIQRMGVLDIKTLTYRDGHQSGAISVAGVDLDTPSKKISEDLNRHIEALNFDKKSESTVMIILDVLGLISALFSAGYEFRRIKIVAAP